MKSVANSGSCRARARNSEQPKLSYWLPFARKLGCSKKEMTNDYTAMFSSISFL